uniref:Uncharacterized protein n=1 Tax=Photinus pyralis TaxID=7054 RepID=A0A1Y1KL78_PHOPY
MKRIKAMTKDQVMRVLDDHKYATSLLANSQFEFRLVAGLCGLCIFNGVKHNRRQAGASMFLLPVDSANIGVNPAHPVVVKSVWRLSAVIPGGTLETTLPPPAKR